MELSDRKKQILKIVVEDYVDSAEPVGSKAIAAQMEGRVSCAGCVPPMRPSSAKP